MPRLDDRPAWRDCLHGQSQRTFDGPPTTSLFPLTTDTDTGAVGVLELRTERALVPSERRSVDSILRLYRKFEGLLAYSERDTLTGLLNRKTFDDAFLKLAWPPAAAGGGTPDPGPERRDAATPRRRPRITWASSTSTTSSASMTASAT